MIIVGDVNETGFNTSKPRGFVTYRSSGFYWFMKSVELPALAVVDLLIVRSSAARAAHRGQARSYICCNAPFQTGH
ncbi:MAG TPA: hypothetical protein VES70_08845, partial [Pseudomonas sp.]|nr:hypothetical protein [Pseudomonas sp.]